MSSSKSKPVMLKDTNDDILVDTFKKFNYESVSEPLICITSNPSDYPNKVVGRMFVWDRGLQIYQPTRFVLVKDTLDEIRNEIPFFLMRVNRDEKDDPVIVESYL